MAAEIALEEQRVALMDQRIQNDRKEADSKAYALEANLKPVRDIDWRTLMAISPVGGDARTTIAMAFHEMAANAQKIGELNISPDLLRSLIATVPTSAGGSPVKGKP
jgi:20S proteasome alpha/beta subunit